MQGLSKGLEIDMSFSKPPEPPDGTDGKILYECEPKGFKDNERMTGDIPEAYRVIECSDATGGGIIIYAKYHGKWEANPWNCRTLVKCLLEELRKC